MSRDVIKEIDEEVNAHPVVLYMKGTRVFPRCGFSAEAAGILEELGVTFHDVDILADPDTREAVKVYSDWQTLPQLYVGGEFIGGRDIMVAMHTNGELAAIVRAAA